MQDRSLRGENLLEKVVPVKGTPSVEFIGDGNHDSAGSRRPTAGEDQRTGSMDQCCFQDHQPADERAGCCGLAEMD
jgi:hypothetical protein